MGPKTTQPRPTPPAAHSEYVAELGPHPPYRIEATSADARLLNATMRQAESWPRYEEITRDQESDLDEVIVKPWGHEYRVYCDPFFDVWQLTIKPRQSTSEHCHPRKSTALICLSGRGKLRLLTGAYMIGAGDLVQIGRGVFHLTENTGEEPLELIEVEVPRNKFDLVRAEDSYGRRASPYTDPSTREIAVPPMEDTQLVDNARYRRSCASGRLRFEVVSGSELLHRRDARLYAALSLATSSALNDTITLLLSPAIWPHTIDRHGVYLAIKNVSQRWSRPSLGGGRDNYKTWFSRSRNPGPTG
jgi:mannose-6-phosphate isomerase-like protein (cupin superfamily)